MSSCALTCSAGYTGMPLIIRCEANSTWSLVTPVCVKIISSSIASTTSYTGGSPTLRRLGDLFIMTCQYGYDGAVSAKCIAFNATVGQWKVTSTCSMLGDYCPNSIVGNAGYVDVSYASNSLGDMCSTMCATGYYGNALSVKCVAIDASRGIWQSLSGCYLNTTYCPVLVLGPGYINMSDTGQRSYESVIDIACAEGYAGLAIDSRCQADNTWSAVDGCYGMFD